jgi:hypothetical protein
MCGSDFGVAPAGSAVVFEVLCFAAGQAGAVRPAVACWSVAGFAALGCAVGAVEGRTVALPDPDGTGSRSGSAGRDGPGTGGRGVVGLVEGTGAGPAGLIGAGAVSCRVAGSVLAGDPGS